MENVAGQDQGASAANAPTTTPADTQTPALPADAIPPDNSQNTSRSQVPDMSQSPVNPQPTNIPLYPAQLGNPVSPYSSSSVNPQSPQITQPTLYLTGVRDVSQVATSNALSQAFSQQDTQGADIYGDQSVANYEHPPIERIKLGPFDLRAAAVTSVVGDDNLRTGGQTNTGGQANNSNSKESDLTFSLTPAIDLIYGAHEGQKGYASLVYSPTLVRFYHESSQDTDDQNVSFNAIYPFQRLTVNVSETYTETSGVNTDSDQRTTQNTSATTAGLSYEIDDKLAVSSQVQATVTSFQGQDTQQPTAAGGNGNGSSGGQGGTIVSINNTLSYRFSEKLTFGPNFNIGRDDTEGQNKSTYEQGLVAANYAPTEKIGMTASGGAEFRQYDQGGGNEINPIFNLGASYTPFDSTVLTLTGSQSVHTSTAPIGQATSGQTVVATSVGAMVTQRLLQRVSLSFAFTYSHDEDSNQGGQAQGQGLGGANTADGSEDAITYQTSVGFSPNEWTSISAYYQYLTNMSDFQGQSYHDNQVGLSLSVQF